MSWWKKTTITEEDLKEIRKEIQNVQLDVAKLTSQIISLRGFMNRRLAVLENLEEEEEEEQEVDAFGLRKN